MSKVNKKRIPQQQSKRAEYLRGVLYGFLLRFLEGANDDMLSLDVEKNLDTLAGDIGLHDITLFRDLTWNGFLIRVREGDDMGAFTGTKFLFYASVDGTELSANQLFIRLETIF